MGMEQNGGALGEIFKRDYAWLCARISRAMGCTQSAQDIASEAFLRVLVSIDPVSIREPRALLTTIAQRLMYEGWRRQDLERAYFDALAQTPQWQQPSPEDQLLLIELLLEVDRLLSGMSSKAKAAFLYHQLDGLTYTQISERLEVSVSRVQQYMVSGFKRCYLALEQV